MRRFAALIAASSVSNVCAIPSLLFTGTDANPTAPLRCSMMNHFVIVSAHRLLGGARDRAGFGTDMRKCCGQLGTAPACS